MRRGRSWSSIFIRVEFWCHKQQGVQEVLYPVSHSPPACRLIISSLPVISIVSIILLRPPLLNMFSLSSWFSPAAELCTLHPSYLRPVSSGSSAALAPFSLTEPGGSSASTFTPPVWTPGGFISLLHRNRHVQFKSSPRRVRSIKDWIITCLLSE